MSPKLTQAEGFILGVGAKMFTIAGPIIVYGVCQCGAWTDIWDFYNILITRMAALK